MGGRGSPPGSESISCHETPNLSWIQPYRSLKGYLSSGIKTVPPSDRRCHTVSSVLLAACLSGPSDASKNNGSKLTIKETDGLILNTGPALIDMKDCPQTSKETISQSPDGVSLMTEMLLIFEFGNTEA